MKKRVWNHLLLSGYGIHIATREQQCPQRDTSLLGLIRRLCRSCSVCWAKALTAPISQTCPLRLLPCLPKSKLCILSGAGSLPSLRNALDTRFISSTRSLVLPHLKLHGLTPELKCTTGAAHCWWDLHQALYEIATVLCDHSQYKLINYFGPASLTLNTAKEKDSLKNKLSIF